MIATLIVLNFVVVIPEEYTIVDDANVLWWSQRSLAACADIAQSQEVAGNSSPVTNCFYVEDTTLCQLTRFETGKDSRSSVERQ